MGPLGWLGLGAVAGKMLSGGSDALSRQVAKDEAAKKEIIDKYEKDQAEKERHYQETRRKY